MPKITLRKLAAPTAAFLLSSAAIFAAAAPAWALSGEPIKIGVISELSGPYSFYGQSCVAGFKFAEKEINADGGILSRPLQLDIVDNQTSPSQSVAAARSVDINDHVIAITGPTSSDNALALYGYAEQNKLPFVVPVAAFPQLTKPGTHYTFRLEPDAVGVGHAAAEYIASVKPGAKVAVMITDFAVSRAFATGFKYQAEKSKLDLVADIVFPQGSNDATIQVAEVAALKPDFIYTNNVGAFDVTLTKQLLDIGIKPEQIIHATGITTAIHSWTKRSIGSLYGTFFDKGIDDLSPAGKQFIARFTKENNRPPSYVENFCYTTPYVFKAAIEKAGSTEREKVRDAISALDIKEPNSGVPIKFDKNGARTEYTYLMRITGLEDNDYSSKQVFYTQWDADQIPVYDLVK